MPTAHTRNLVLLSILVGSTARCCQMNMKTAFIRFVRLSPGDCFDYARFYREHLIHVRLFGLEDLIQQSNQNNPANTETKNRSVGCLISNAVNFWVFDTLQRFIGENGERMK